MDSKDKKTKNEEKISEAERQKQNQDFENLPAASEKQNPPAIDKKDINKSSEINKEGKMDNMDKE